MRSLAAFAVLLAVTTGCGTADSTTATPPSSSSASETTAAAPSAGKPSGGPVVAGKGQAVTRSQAPPGCLTVAAGFDCDFQRRIGAAQAYLGGRPGTVGVILRDRRTGAVWRSARAGREVWTASTIKLAMVVDLLVRERAGTVTLTAADRANIRAMLHTSDDNAADAVWRAHGRAAFNTRFPAYGVTGAHFVAGFDRYWGFMKCTPADLDRLIVHVLTRLPSDLRAYLLGELRGVAPNQQWGVWGAGPAARPGNKNGWSEEQGGWVINSVGFAGPGERYTLTLMNSLDGKGGYDAGVATVTRVSALLLAGRS